MTVSEQLAQINTAITAIETGAQEYRINNRSLRRADLSLLYKERRALQRELEQEQAQQVDETIFGNTFVAKFAGR
jgi:hypothetical protein